MVAAGGMLIDQPQDSEACVATRFRRLRGKPTCVFATTVVAHFQEAVAAASLQCIGDGIC